MALLYGLSVSLHSLLVSLLPLGLIFAYILITKRTKKLSRSLKFEDFFSGDIITLSTIEKELCDIKEITAQTEEFQRLKRHINLLLKQLKNGIKFQRWLYYASVLIAPLFPVVSTVFMFFFKSQRWIITVVSGYIAMFLLLIIVVSGSDNLLKNLEKIEKELKDLLRKYKNEN
ncbi:MAG: hypothetical protein PWQ27_1194 [Kosmotoga sp.]|nr:hypothetical protein [Kosmotoga sp.]